VGPWCVEGTLAHYSDEKRTHSHFHTQLLSSSSIYFISLLLNCACLGFFGYTHTHTHTQTHAVIKGIHQSGVEGGYEVLSFTVPPFLPTEIHNTETSRTVHDNNKKIIIIRKCYYILPPSANE